MPFSDSEMKAGAGLFVGAVVIATVGAVAISPVLVPAAMAVGLIGAPIFGANALYHKAKLGLLQKKEITPQNKLERLKEESKMRKSVAKMKSLAVCIIPLGFISQVINPISSKRAKVLDEQIKQLKGRQ